MIKKIILITLIITILTATASAVEIADLNIPSYYIEDTNGLYELNTDENVHLYIGNYSLNEEVFNSNVEDGYLVTNIGNNTYYFIDETLNQAGLQELVEIDGVKYVISISKDKTSELSNADKVLFEEDLNKINNDNDLTPVEVWIRKGCS